jgi:acyl-CoA oxidase
MDAMSNRQPRVTADDLARVRLFGGFSPQQRQRVLDAAETSEVAPGTTLVEEGEPDTDLYVLLSGAASVSLRLESGARLDVGTLQPGDSFGELAALLRDRRSASVIASEPCRLLRIREERLLSLIEDDGQVGLAVCRALARELASLRGEQNELRAEATSQRSVTTARDASGMRAYLARYYLTTARNLLRRQQLLTASEQPVYRADLTVSANEARSWHELFGAPADGPDVPYTYHVTAWTALLMELAEDLGINFRNLSHHRTRLTMPSPGGLEIGGTYRVQVRTAEVVPLADGRVELVVVTWVTRNEATPPVTSTDTFEVANIDRTTLRRLEARRPPDAAPADALSTVEGAGPVDEDPPLRERGLVLADDLGVRYGRLSGNLSPAHTSRAGARLMGHDRPFLQHLCVLNLVLRQLTELDGRAPTQLDVSFDEPVHAGTTVALRAGVSHLELLDEDGERLVTGTYVGADPDAVRTAAETAAAPGPTHVRSRAVEGVPAPGDGDVTTLEHEPQGHERRGAGSSEHGPDDREPQEVRSVDREPIGLDVASLQQLLAGERSGLRDRVRSLLTSPGFEHDPDLSRADYRDRVLTWCRVLADEGLGLLAFPRDVGGQDDPAAAMAVVETLAEHDLSLVTKYGVQIGLFGGAILHLGTARHHERYLRPAGELRLPGCFALTELGHGSDARSIRTSAVYEPTTERFTITTPDDDSRKEYIGNAAAHGRLAVVFAQLQVDGVDRGVHAFLVPIRDEHGDPMPGVRIGDCGAKMGLNGVDNGRLWFDRVQVPWEALLDRYGQVSVDGVYTSPLSSPNERFFTMLATLVQGRVTVGLVGVSTARSALTIATRYAERRRQFAPPSGPETPLLDYRTHQRRLIIPLATTYGLHFALRDLADDYVTLLEAPDVDPRDRMQLESRAAGLKALATTHATATIQQCREACGGAGYMWENRFGALKADSDVLTTFEGDNTVLMQLVTKTLLTDFKQQFEDMDPAAMARYLLGRVVSAVIPTPASRRTDEAHLRERSFHLEIFRAREQVQLTDLARRLKRALEDGSDPHSAFVRHQTRVMEVAGSHVERTVLERFTAAIEGCHDRDLVGPLSRLCDLYALSRLERHRAWYLEHGLFAASKSRAIVGQVDRLCAELRPHAVDLVDAFGIPDALLAAPIGRTIR